MQIIVLFMYEKYEIRALQKFIFGKLFSRPRIEIYKLISGYEKNIEKVY